MLTTTELLLIVAVTFLLNLFANRFLPAYITKKGENLATREDIEGITKKVEEIKAEFARNIELLKTDLQQYSHVQGAVFDKEFTVLSAVWSAVADLRNATLAFMEIEPDGTELADVETRRARLNRFNTCYSDLAKEVLRNKPFYALTIFTSLEDLLIRTKEFSFDYDLRYGWSQKDRQTIGGDFDGIINAIEKVCEDIRARVVGD
jgi:hypothetical protein